MPQRVLHNLSMRLRLPRLALVPRLGSAQQKNVHHYFFRKQVLESEAQGVENFLGCVPAKVMDRLNSWLKLPKLIFY
jgi:hypothetical protein